MSSHRTTAGASLVIDARETALVIDQGGGITVSDAKSPTVNTVASADGNVPPGFATAPHPVKAVSTGGSAEVFLPESPETYRVGAGALGGLVSDPAGSRTGKGRATVAKAG